MEKSLMKKSFTLMAAVGLLAISIFGCAPEAEKPAGEAPPTTTPETKPVGTAGAGEMTFASAVKPILDAKCIFCHNANKASEGLALDTLEGLQKGGEHGALYEAGKGKDSMLVQFLDGRKQPQMPMKAAPLSAEEIDTIVKWIDAGAK